MSSVECKLKQDTTINLAEWRKSVILTPPNTGENVGQQELSFIAGEDAE